jgi:hypothetical protein
MIFKVILQKYKSESLRLALCITTTCFGDGVCEGHLSKVIFRTSELLLLSSLYK